MQKLVYTIVCFVLISAVAGQDTTEQIVPGRLNSPLQQQKPYVILISADGFRHDFAEKYQAKNLLQLRKKGITAAYITPSFPSLTFPNHYTIVTGLYPAHHGLVDNSFFDIGRKQTYTMANKKMVADPYWYGGTPLWVLAEQQQMIAASFYWVASEAPIQQLPPTYHFFYNEKIGIDARIEKVKQWLSLPEEKRPHFISFYFPEVDHAAHTYGPDSRETGEAVQFVDESIGRLHKVAEASGLPVNFILVADHGMTKVDYEHTLPYPATIDTAKFLVTNGSAVLQLYAKDTAAIPAMYLQLKKEAKDYDVYLKKDMPEKFHYQSKDDYFNRIGDIILLAKNPKIFTKQGKPTGPGKHGYDPTFPDMHASFQAWGPAFKKGLKINGFENIHIYPLIATILGLNYDASKIDGKKKVLEQVLKTEKYEIRNKK
ncbi:MAG: ectonucleotide pyrophosphatase/phosphodiesterase [Bacteroidota bacterium]